jgi:hypothetical protein
MLITRTVLALALTAGGGSLAHAAPASPDRAAPPRPAERTERPNEVFAERLLVNYADVYALANVLKDIFAVRPERGPVRAILHDKQNSTLVVFATPAGHAEVRRVLDRLLPPSRP